MLKYVLTSFKIPKRHVSAIKARVYETAALGTMQITMLTDNLEDYYVSGKEIVLYSDTEDLMKKIRYYLAHDAEREAIARAGYERTIRDHTTEARYFDLFQKIGKPL